MSIKVRIFMLKKTLFAKMAVIEGPVNNYRMKAPSSPILRIISAEEVHGKRVTQVQAPRR